MAVGSGNSTTEPYWNNFGAQVSQVPSLYPGTVIDDYDEIDGGEVILDALNRATERIVNAMPERVHTAISRPELVFAELRATQNQTTVQIPWGSAIENSLHVWWGYPKEFSGRPRTLYELNHGEGKLELASSQYSVNYQTGVITLGVGMPEEAQCILSYLTNMSSATFSIPSLARIAIRGAAAELGARLYSDGEQYTWGLVTKYQADFDRDVEQLMKGELIPPEVRALKFWEPLQPAAESGGRPGSVRLWRAT